MNVDINNRIRVLCVFSTLDRGGAESMCMNLYRNMDRNKVQFDFVKHTKRIGAFEKEINELGGRIFEAPRFKIGNIVRYCIWWRRHLNTHPEHVIIHGHFFGISPVYFRIAKKMGRKTVGHIHTSKANTPIKALFVKFMSRVTDYPLACSKIAGEWAYGKREFTVLNNAIDAEKFRANAELGKSVRNELSLGNVLVLCNIGNFSNQKNPFGTLEIFRRVNEHRRDSKLLWIGNGSMLSAVQDKVKEIGLQEKVIFTGVRTDVERLLQAVDAFVFPSYYEGLGIVAIEAQAAGVQTFCSDVVPEEASVTNLCHFMSLDDYEAWVSEILKVAPNTMHPDMFYYIKEAGFDVHDTVKWLQDFYINISLA